MAYNIVCKLKRLWSDFLGVVVGETLSQNTQVLLSWPQSGRCPMNQGVMLTTASSRSKHFHCNPCHQKSELCAMLPSTLLSILDLSLTLKYLVGRTKITSRNMKNINVRSPPSAVQEATLERGGNWFWASQSTLAITVLFQGGVGWAYSVMELCCLLTWFSDANLHVLPQFCPLTA